MARSPNYPRLTLEEAVERAARIYKKEHTHAAPKEVIVQDLGYGSVNGASMGIVSTLKSYGLLENVGDGMKVSDDAVTIIELPEDDSERIEALRRVAFTPRLFAEMRDTFGDMLPSDVRLRHYLIKDKKFLSKAADEVIRIYRDTLEFVPREMQGYTVADESVDEQQETPMQQPQQTANVRAASHDGASMAPPAGQGSFTEYLTIPIKGRKIRLLVDGEVTQEVLTSFGRYLRLVRDDLPDDPVEGQDEADTEEGSIIAKESADSLLD